MVQRVWTINKMWKRFNFCLVYIHGDPIPHVLYKPYLAVLKADTKELGIANGPKTIRKAKNLLEQVSLCPEKNANYFNFIFYKKKS